MCKRVSEATVHLASAQCYVSNILYSGENDLAMILFLSLPMITNKISLLILDESNFLLVKQTGNPELLCERESCRPGEGLAASALRPLCLVSHSVLYP